MTHKVFVGTVKGLFLLEKISGRWRVKNFFFEGQMVYSVGKSGDRLWVSPSSEWTGAGLFYSDDGAKNWHAAKNPLKFPDKADASLKKIWQIAADESGKLFFGVEPSALFTSEDNGESFDLCEGLWNHPHREKWSPGYGGLCLHTILVLSDSIWVAGTSTGGVYRTEDGGKTWTACNQKIKTPFLPEETPEFGQCVHKIAGHRSNPQELFLQHHWGVYRSGDGGQNWDNISEEKGLPSDFGFACVSNNPGTAYIIPINSDEFRVFPDGKMRVYRTEDSGANWKELSEGLPQENVYDSVLRDSFAAGESGELAVGTTGGHVYFSDDFGESWSSAAEYLPRITCVRIFSS